MKGEMHDKLQKDIEKNVNGYLNTDDVKKHFLNKLNNNKNVKEELYYLTEAQKEIISRKATIYEITRDLCKQWLPVLMCCFYTGSLGGIFAATNVYYQGALQKKKLEIQSSQETIDIMGQIIKQFQDKAGALTNDDHSNPNLNQMNWSTNAMTRREQENQEINI